jgi:FkbM family methyltransferase
MIKYIKYSKEESKIYYSNTTNEVLDVRVDFVEGYSNSLIQSHNLTLHPDVIYWTIGHVIWDNNQIKFYNQKTNELITTFVVSGDKSLQDLDTHGYLKEVQSINDIHQQCGINDVLKEHFFVRQYEKFVDIEEGDIVVDVGFNFGVFSLGALNKGASKIYGFEPNKDIYEKLKKYPNQDKVEIFNYAVSNKYDTMKFNEGYNTLGSSITFTGNDIKKTYDVEVINLYDFLIKNDITKIDFLKVDCEGEEYNIFESIPNEFLCEINKIHVEFHNNLNGEVKQLIEKLENNNFDWFFEKDKNEKSECGLIFAKKKTKNTESKENIQKNKIKKIALISTFCDNKEKLDLLVENIKKIKSLGIDVMIISPLKLNDEVIELCDYSIFSKENPILDWPEKSYFQWWGGNYNGVNINMTTTYPDYGYAGLLQIKRMADFALSMDYEIFFPMIYDINITPYVESVFNGSKKNSFFPSYRDGMTWSIGLHLISLDREHLIRFKTLITKESYLVEGDFDAFAWLHRAVKLIPGVIEEEPIEDLIYFLSNKDFFNCSPSDKFKCFIHKTLIDNDNMKIVFYDFGGIKQFNIKTDSFENNYEVREWDEIKLPFLNTDKLIIANDGEIFDLSDYVNNIGNNTFTKL